MMNPFLKPVHEVLTDEFRPYPELRDAVNAKIQSGEMNAGCHDSCDFMWFDELAQTGYAERKTVPIYGPNNTPRGGRNYFRLRQDVA